MLRAFIQYHIKKKPFGKVRSKLVRRIGSQVLSKLGLFINPEIEKLRKQLKKDKSKIDIVDLGAGSKKGGHKQRTIAEIVKTAAIPQKQGAFIAGLMHEFKLKKALELGTSLGLGTLYMATANEGVEVFTIEGCPNTAKRGQVNFEQLGIENVRMEIGDFSQKLVNIKEKKFDLVYIDGNHRLEPTVEYFEFALGHTKENAFIIFDDIHWSKEMEQAWERIKMSNKATICIDCFRFGLVYKSANMRKQNYTLKF